VSDARYELSIDIGGTFTDLVLADVEGGSTWLNKVLTTPSDPAAAVQQGIEGLLEQSSVATGEIHRVLHATTLATNALIERTGARTALLTTAGFRDVLEMRDESRYDLFDLLLELPTPLVPRELRLGVPERVLADGSVDTALDVDAAKRTIGDLRDSGVEAVAICLLHSFRNPEHELQLGELVRTLLPEAELSLSHEVAPEIREYPRTATTVANVYVKRLVQRYMRELRARLTGMGIEAELFIMLSGGSLCAVETAGRFPVRLIESGPAAGALAAAAYAQASEVRDLISFDMGGTTAKACLIDGGAPHRSDQFEVDRVWRFRAGSGSPIRTPVIDLIEIGAGGGSIAWIDELGVLRVGPASAGADPGPACYGRGGTEPTVTDANLVLGYLGAGTLLGGWMPLDLSAARHAIETKIARPLGIDAVQAAWGIHRMVNETMAGAARMAATERGKDPRAYPVFAFGGAGPAHAFGVAQILRSPAVAVANGAGVMSAVGLLCAPVAFELVHSFLGLLDDIDLEAVAGLCNAMEREGRGLLDKANVPESEIAILLSADMRYAGQGHEIRVELPARGVGDRGALLRAAFEATYRRRFGRLLNGMAIEIVNWRCTATGPVPGRMSVQESRRNGDFASRPRVRSRPIYVPDVDEFVAVPVLQRSDMSRMPFKGPLVVEDAEATVVVSGPARVRSDDDGTIVIEPCEPVSAAAV
jgi:N-methylhydantoinase A